MLIYNIDIEDSLVNGAFGTVTNIVHERSEKDVKFVEVQFDNKNIRGITSSNCLGYLSSCPESGKKVYKLFLHFTSII